MAEVKRKQMWSEHTGNPVCVIEDDTLQNGFYYNKDTGIFEGSVTDCIGDETRVFSCLGKNADKYIEPKQINISNKEFLISANIIAHESGTEGEECICIAFTTRNRSRKVRKSIYHLLMSGYSSVPNNEKKEMKLDTQDKKSLDARVGVIAALLDGKDPTNGAEFWDGTDFLAWGTGIKEYNRVSHAKFRQYGIIFIKKEIYTKYLTNNIKRYPNGKITYSSYIYSLPHIIFDDPKNWKSGDFSYKTNAIHPSTNKPITENLIATTSVGNTIFWRVER